MKQFLPIVIVLVVFASTTTHLFAETSSQSGSLTTNTSTPSGKTTERKAAANTRREEFRQKVATIKDEKKQALLTKIDAKLAAINAQKTNQMSQSLQKLTTILSTVSTKRDTLKAAGKDTKTLDLAITTATTSLTTAQATVTAQAGKEYILTIQSETTLKTTVGSTVKQLELDLMTTNKTVIAARQAVRKAAEELAKLKGEEKMATPSATIVK